MAALRDRRRQLDRSQEDVAEHLGIATSQISKYENQTREPGLSEAIAWAAELGLDPVVLVGKPSREPTPSPGQQPETGRLEEIIRILCTMWVQEGTSDLPAVDLHRDSEMLAQAILGSVRKPVSDSLDVPEEAALRVRVHDLLARFRGEPQ